MVYTDHSRELKAAIEQLGYRRQTSIEYVDSSKSFAEREMRHLLEGARANLVQSAHVAVCDPAPRNCNQHTATIERTWFAMVP